MSDNEFIAFISLVIFSAAFSLIKISSGRKKYGAGNWPQTITKPPEKPNFGVNRMPVCKRPKPAPAPPKKLYARKTEWWDV